MSDSAHPGGAGLPDINHGPRIIVGTAITTGLALLSVLARLYVRFFVIRNVGLDDYTMAFTMLLSLCGFAIIIPEVNYGAGRHTVYVQDTATKAIQLNFATQVIYLWGVGLVKVAIGLFLLRFAPRRGYRIFIWSVIVFMMLYTTICFFTEIFQCKDIRAIWDMTVKSKCFTPKQLLELSYVNAGFNVLTDVVFAILPIFMLRHLQVNKRVKASLICILGLGLFACVAGCVKISILTDYGKTGDLLWDYTNLTIWVVAECNTGIMAGSLPALKPLFKTILNTYGSRSKTRQYGYGSKHYRLRSLTRSQHGKQQSFGGRGGGEGGGGGGSSSGAHGAVSLSRSGNRSALGHETDDDRKGPQAHYAEATTMTSYQGQSGNNSSEERILPPADSAGIVCTTEVSVLRSLEAAEGIGIAHSGDDGEERERERARTFQGTYLDVDDRV
ncbi:hypothetical protein NUU61_002809 [Penicillium alfredii]|uniref:Rhodopsin domain-containing protein n=1 Tax=Penicillium alfredii TaxID=1506179 RepID=A0A9W9FSD0_9EURO|nr:uncharacterized protein NUU61_002809 [Penicillium alfredii]KAJ5105462.1 hypothetical protein NUU61_002809 [Penicillium alfredii]